MALDFASMFGGGGGFWGDMINNVANQKLQNPTGKLSNMFGSAAGSAVSSAFAPAKGENMDVYDKAQADPSAFSSPGDTDTPASPDSSLVKPIANSSMVQAAPPDIKIGDKAEPIGPPPPKSDSILSQILKLVVAAVAA